VTLNFDATLEVAVAGAKAKPAHPELFPH
jgi:hypothetical protein